MKTTSKCVVLKDVSHREKNQKITRSSSTIPNISTWFYVWTFSQDSTLAVHPVFVSLQQQRLTIKVTMFSLFHPLFNSPFPQCPMIWNVCFCLLWTTFKYRTETVFNLNELILFPFHSLFSRTPAMIGCSFVVDREYFGQIGLLDPGMEVYGGENIELGMRVGSTIFSFHWWLQSPPRWFITHLLLWLGTSRPGSCDLGDPGQEIVHHYLGEEEQCEHNTWASLPEEYQMCLFRLQTRWQTDDSYLLPFHERLQSEKYLISGIFFLICWSRPFKNWVSQSHRI